MAEPSEVFSLRDFENLERLKDAMAEKALGQSGVLGDGPDAAAASAFAQLMDAETRRQELVLKVPSKAPALSEAVTPTSSVDERLWTQKVGSGDAPMVAAAAAAG